MTTVNEVVNFAKDLANRGQGVDYDGWYGNQCVDLPNWICGKFFGKALWGNAIDLIKSAKQHGFEVHYMPTSESPRPGAIFVKNYWAGDGINYGHTGLIIGVSGNTVQTIEQNLVGNLSVGGPAQYSSQQISNLVGWFYPPYSDSTAVATQAAPKVATAQPRTASVNTGDREYAETGVFTATEDIYFRNEPNLNGRTQGMYYKGESVTYDRVRVDYNGFVWISWISASTGIRRWMPIKVRKNGQTTEVWGNVK
ncbi:CHAP domain-containing protein [Streptococcus suis]|uniref:CHAP domain-containing protein n=2 Tax=Streptococcus suis TaxID=1307 RepID=UPI00211BAB52|nr:CHAP domain-containing protein [Streptococcus suis]UUM50478.1 CHAP domain-containing protein [Streptococcus suis]HEL1782509.1 CHAP domain-containing protein [Streptococcus suis]HEL1798362.1 CHAP domain-containing protein [Streptococcus suis]HEL2595487.1 CHAP domain-containing protein [Streptococcus suis]HEM2638874.1 CHAP domain-containing protein [Streptococcus suis]